MAADKARAAGLLRQGDFLTMANQDRVGNKRTDGALPWRQAKATFNPSGGAPAALPAALGWLGGWPLQAAPRFKAARAAPRARKSRR